MVMFTEETQNLDTQALSEPDKVRLAPITQAISSHIQPHAGPQDLVTCQ